MAQNSGIDTFLAGFFIGGVIGAGVALLFAPASGKETRSYLKDQFGTAVEGSKSELEKLRVIMREELVRLGESKEAFKDAVHAGIDAYKTRGDTEEATE